MLGADVVGFQGRQWGENFLLSVRELEDVHVDIRAHRAEVDGREVQVRSFPVAVGAQEIREAAASDRAKRLRAQVEKIRGDRKLLLRVDRMEPSKNILRGFLAFELLLQKHPEWRGRVVFLALLSPSREEVPAYRDYGADCRATADRINAAFGKEEWTPIVLKVQENFTYAVAAYDQYDAMLVNPVHDGMNLVAMEGSVLNSRGGVLILSRNAGAFGRLGRHALAINPFDLSETAEAIHEALEMPDEERTRRARGLQRSALAHTPATWLAGQLRAIDEVRAPTLLGRRGARGRARSAIEPEQRRDAVRPLDDEIRRGLHLRRRLRATRDHAAGPQPVGSEPLERRERVEVAHVVPGEENPSEVRVRARSARPRRPCGDARDGVSSRMRLPGTISRPCAAAIAASDAADAASAASGSSSPRKWTAAAAPFGSTQAPTAAAAASISPRTSAGIGGSSSSPCVPTTTTPSTSTSSRTWSEGRPEITATTSSRLAILPSVGLSSGGIRASSGRATIGASVPSRSRKTPGSRRARRQLLHDAVDRSHASILRTPVQRPERRALDAQDRPRPRLEASLRDELPAAVADPVRPVLDLLERTIDVVEHGVELPRGPDEVQPFDGGGGAVADALPERHRRIGVTLHDRDDIQLGHQLVTANTELLGDFAGVHELSRDA